MKKHPVLLPAFLGFLLCCFSQLCWAERYETVTVRYNKYESFPAVSGTPHYSHALLLSKVYAPMGDFQPKEYTHQQGGWQFHNHTGVTAEFYVRDGEKATILGHSAFLRGTAPTTYKNFSLDPVFSHMEIDREVFDENQTIDGRNIPNSKIYGPCKLKFYFIPGLYRGIPSFKWGTNHEFADQDGFLIGFGGFEYAPSEGFVNLRIEGSQSDTSVGSLLGGSSTSGVSGKNYVTVIPENSPKNVRIVLEQSTDLINWSAANQGVFSPSTTRRFFRVRSEEE
jgi:hypothetical protein